MLTLLRTIAWILVVLAILAGASYFLPRHLMVTRSIGISAPPEVVFEQVNSLRAFSEWSPWSEMDPEMDVIYSGPAEGVGNRMEWASTDPEVGSGSQEITESVANESVRSALDFGDMGTAEAWFTLVAQGDGTNVTWGLDADMGNSPIGRYMGVMMDRWVGADYEEGLARLKARAEAAAAEPDETAPDETAPEAVPEGGETVEESDAVEQSGSAGAAGN